jgi:hypothetical protein
MYDIDLVWALRANEKMTDWKIRVDEQGRTQIQRQKM